MTHDPERSTPRAASRRPRRRGYGLIELTLSLVLLVAAMGFMVKVLVWVGAERQAAERRQWAVMELSNALERVVSEPYDKVSADRASEIVSAIPRLRDLSGAECQATVAEQPGPPVTGRQVTVRLRWKTRSGEWDAPVILSAWVFKVEKARESSS